MPEYVDNMLGISSNGKPDSFAKFKPCKLLDESAKVYKSLQDNSEPMRTIYKGEIFLLGDICKGNDNIDYISIMFSDGTKGFIDGNVKVFLIQSMRTMDRNTPVYSNPSLDSSLSFKLKRNSSVIIFDEVTENNKHWIILRDSQGREGYVAGGTLFIDSNLETPGGKDMLHGALWCIGGIVATAIGYSMVSESGGTYLIFWGAIIFGAIQFFKGLARTINQPEQQSETLLRSYLQTKGHSFAQVQSSVVDSYMNQPSPANLTWKCPCGEVNIDSASRCRNCETPRPQAVK